MQLAIDTASELASVALAEDGRLRAEITWRCRRNHTVELLPTIDRLLSQAGVQTADLTAIFVCAGPGMYTGLRVGIAAAKGLAVALGLPLLGAGRLELDAYPHTAFAGTVIAVHRAGRGEYAWAAYEGGREVRPPQLAKPGELAAGLSGRVLVVGEVDEALHDALINSRADVSFPPPAAAIRRAASLAELAHARLTAGERADPALLRPIYLRPPAIGPQQR